MKILRVKLSNLNSLRGSHEIDFEAAPLGGAGLFAITGATGAGKSTLLDAITLALYGRAARYGTVPSPEDMMSRHCGGCTAEVEFRVSSGTYRAEWQLHRARGKAAGKVQGAKRYVYDSTGQPMAQSVRETEELIEKLIGLDYSRFLRSVLLAQGDFAQFLKANPNDKAELLESLTGTSIYSALGTLAHTVTGGRENELRAKEALIQNIPLLEEPVRLKLIADIPATEARLELVKKELLENGELLNKAENLARALSQEAEALKRQEALKSERARVTQDLQRLALHRLTIPFNGELAKLESAEKEATGAQGRLATLQGEHLEAVRKARAFWVGFGAMLSARIAGTKEKVSPGEQAVRDAISKRANAANWLEQHVSEKELQAGLSDFVSELTHLKEARKNLAREWVQIRTLIAKVDASAAVKLSQPAHELSVTSAGEIVERAVQLAGTLNAAAVAAQKEAETELAMRDDHLKKAHAIAGFAQHRADLKKGEACPLCGAAEHPFAEGMEPTFPFNDLDRRVAEGKRACRAREKRCDELEASGRELRESGKNLVAVVKECGEALSALARKLRELELGIPAEGAEDEFKLALQRRAAEYSKQARELEKAERDRVEGAKELERLKSDLVTLEEKRVSLAEEKIATAEQSGSGTSAGFVAPRWASVEAAERDWGAAKNNLTTAEANYGSGRKDEERLSKVFLELRTDLAASLAGSAFAEIGALKAARLGNSEAARLEQFENELKRREQEVQSDLRRVRETIEQGRKEALPEGEAVAALRAQGATFQNKNDQLVGDIRTWRESLKQDDVNRLAVANKETELAADRKQLVVWQRLRGLIGSHDGRTFRRYAQSVSLDVLVHYANRQLLRLNDRYQLRRREGDELELEIEDLHQAGAVRPMASLSGGESFLASLALALGLSDIAGRNVRIESLFIDEGFGSLDSDTLDVAISALEALRQDNKTVGVISHVDLLKERIATQIIVEKQAGGTSSLRITG
ncbi:MAG: hypothetical protein JWM99_1438 [Verrucomicrobiales bacterium]|nr:hypothetical protein [Verrucomicrobiales bacterium]